MKFFRPKNQKTGFTLVEIMIVVLIIGILLAIAIPNFVSARESSRAKACVGNLKQIDSAKQQCAMDNKIAGNAPDTFNVTTDAAGTASTATPWKLVDTTGTSGYLRSVPACPSGKVYYPGTVVQTPWCTNSASVAGVPIAAGTTGATANYGQTEKWYHGLN